MSNLYTKSQQKLELSGVLELLASCACSEDGKNVCLNLRPTSDLDDVKQLLEQTTAAYGLCTKKGTPTFTGIVNISGHNILHIKKIKYLRFYVRQLLSIIFSV